MPTYQRTYDLDGRLTSYPTDLLGTVRAVTYNAASMVTAYTHSGGPNPAQYDQSFVYDTADRLTSFTLGGVTTTYTYDANGNRTQQTNPNVTYTYSTTSNRLSSATLSVPRTYTYDVAGNRIGDGLFTYTYSDRGRLAQVGGNTVLNMYYNALGQRVLKVGANGFTSYVYDEAGHTVGEYAQGTLLGVETVYLNDLPVTVLAPQGNFYVITDHINTPLVLAQSNGTNVWDWRNRDPFGNNAPLTSTTLTTYDHRFPGQLADVETGLFYNYFRDYDPQTGRYIESDPIGVSGGVNTYAYVAGNPLIATDSQGLDIECYGIVCRVVLPTITPSNASVPSASNTSYYDDDGRGRGRGSRDDGRGRTPSGVYEKKPSGGWRPPPPPSNPAGERFPQDWRGQCIALYEMCVQNRWTGNCGQCLNKCTAQQEWPFGKGPGFCSPRRKKNSCNLGDE